MLTSVWSTQHPNAGQNVHQVLVNMSNKLELIYTAKMFQNSNLQTNKSLKFTSYLSQLLKQPLLMMPQEHGIGHQKK